VPRGSAGLREVSLGQNRSEAQRKAADRAVSDQMGTDGTGATLKGPNWKEARPAVYRE
jgi:hypothetical protein